MRPVTACIATRSRPAALERCIRSLALARDQIERAIVVDDASDPPVDRTALSAWACEAGLPVDLVRLSTHTGVTAARNLAARRAATFAILSLDDDAFLVNGEAVAAALHVLAADPHIAAIAFAQADERGLARPPALQPAPSVSPCYVPTFIGFAALITRDRLLETGGFREEFIIHGEERELALRWLERGYRVVYLPDALVAHVADASNRDPRAYIRHVIRNDCLNALYNEPILRAAVSIPVRLWNFTRMARGVPGGDPDGVRWIVGELRRHWQTVRTARKPVKWRTLRLWRQLRLTLPAYRIP